MCCTILPPLMTRAGSIQSGDKTLAKTYSAGVKEYRETYWMPDYKPKDTDILACFKITPQPGVPREEAANCPKGFDDVYRE